MRPSPPAAPRRPGRLIRPYALAAAAYLAVSVVLWWHVWSTHPTAVTTCGCGDASLFLWFLEWPAYALAHGHNPFYSTALFHPAGIDLLSNTSVLAVGMVLAPVTWLFGPVATLNVASTLGPVASALALFWFLRRLPLWTPAAFVGGLLFGFSPFVFVNLAGGHLMTGVLVFVPLMAGWLDEILVRQRHGPVAAGVVLGLLVVGQFFVSTEVLVIVAMAAATAVVVVVAYVALFERPALARRAPYAGRALAVAGAVAVVVLAYPLWFTFDGPAHLSGLVWPTLEPGAGGIVLSNLWHLRVMTGLRQVMQVVGGYEGPSLPQGEYLGLGLLVVVGAGLLLWWRDRRLRLFAALGAVGVVLSLGVETHAWVPWRLLAHIPLVRSIIPGRFVVVTTFAAAVAVSVVVDRTHDAARRMVARAGRAPARHRVGGAAAAVTVAGVGADTGPAGDTGAAGPTPRSPVVVGAVASALALAVAAVAVVPVASALAPNVPLTTEAVVVPAWFSRVAPRLPPGRVVLAVPAPFSLIQTAMTWQAVDRLHFALVGGSGPEGIPARAGPERPGMEVVSAASISLVGPPSPTPPTVAALRAALAGWGVTDVVIPDPRRLPHYDRGTDPPAALGLFTLAVGRAPRYVDQAWVWSAVRRLGPALAVTVAAFDACATAAELRSAPLAVPDCVLAAARPGAPSTGPDIRP